MTPTDLMSQCKRILNLDLNSKELGCLVVQMLEDDEANENAKRSKNSNAMLSTAALAANVEKELLGAEATEAKLAQLLRTERIKLFTDFISYDGEAYILVKSW